MARIVDIGGIGKKHAQKLNDLGVHSTQRLLDIGATKLGRQDLSEHTGIAEDLILEWVNLADLMRIKGIAEEYSDLLEEAGVETIKELRKRSPEKLHDKLIQTNEAKSLVRRLPSLDQVQSWVHQARDLSPRLRY